MKIKETYVGSLLWAARILITALSIGFLLKSCATHSLYKGKHVHGLESCPEAILKEESSLRYDCLRYLISLGPRAWPVIFRTAIKADSPSILTYWDSCIMIAKESGLCPAYECLFAKGDTAEDIMTGYAISIKDTPYWFFNPIPAYEKVMGIGSWPKDLPVSLIEDLNKWPKAKLDPNSPPRWGVKELEQYVEKIMSDLHKKPVIEEFPPKAFWGVVRRGPDGIEAVLRAWVKTRDCDILLSLGQVLVEGTQVGLFNYRTILQTLDMTLEEALNKKRFIYFHKCTEELKPVFTDLKFRIENKRKENEIIPWSVPKRETYTVRELYSSTGTLWDGHLLLIDPRIAYEEKKGRNSWPKDLSLEVLGASYPQWQSAPEN